METKFEHFRPQHFSLSVENTNILAVAASVFLVFPDHVGQSIFTVKAVACPPTASETRSYNVPTLHPSRQNGHFLSASIGIDYKVLYEVVALSAL
jgi:hypothetical protein